MQRGKLAAITAGVGSVLLASAGGFVLAAQAGGGQGPEQVDIVDVGQQTEQEPLSPEPRQAAPVKPDEADPAPVKDDAEAPVQHSEPQAVEPEQVEPAPVQQQDAAVDTSSGTEPGPEQGTEPEQPTEPGVPPQLYDELPDGPEGNNQGPQGTNPNG